MTMAKMKKKAKEIEWFNVLSFRAPSLERPTMNIIKDLRVYVGETMYQGKTLRSREATFDKARDALYDQINIITEAQMPNIIMKKKKTTRGEASTAKYHQGRKMEQREKLIKKLAELGFRTKLCPECRAVKSGPTFREQICPI